MDDGERIEKTRYVVADDSEFGVTRCFAAIPPRAERVKDPFRHRKHKVYFYARSSLSSIYSGDRDWSWLEKSPFWARPRLVNRNDIPTGVEIP